MIASNLAGYFLLCILMGTFLPWILFWWLYAISFSVGFFVARKTKLNIRKVKIVSIFYLLLTPIFFTLLAAVEPVLGISGSYIDAVPLPGTSTIALLHAFAIWVVMSYLLGLIAGNSIQQRKAKKELIPTQVSQDHSTNNAGTSENNSNPKFVSEYEQWEREYEKQTSISNEN